MAEPIETTVTRLLEQLDGGHRSALDQLFPLVYGELRALAHSHRQRWFGDETLGTTALVHEAYLKLVGQQWLGTRNRAHFLATAAQAMRHILSNYAEARRRLKRGGGAQKVSLDATGVEPAAVDLTDDQAEMLDALDVALTRLNQTNARLSRVVECRFFAGMSIADTAVALESSPATIKRDWVLARAWLYREIQAVYSSGGSFVSR
jgi:RNA polymerase sigma factor (TIGR02999 family)